MHIIVNTYFKLILVFLSTEVVQYFHLCTIQGLFCMKPLLGTNKYTAHKFFHGNGPHSKKNHSKITLGLPVMSRQQNTYLAI